LRRALRGMSGCSRACSRRLDDGWGASQMAAFRRRPTKGSVAVARPSMGLVQAEFVALGIAQNISEWAAVIVRRDQPGAEAGQPIDLGLLALGLDVNVQMDTVLGRLALGHQLDSRGSISSGSRHAATSRNADLSPIVTRSSAGIRPSATSWSTKSEWSSTCSPSTAAQNAACACGLAASKVTCVLMAYLYRTPPTTSPTRANPITLSAAWSRVPRTPRQRPARRAASCSLVPRRASRAQCTSALYSGSWGQGGPEISLSTISASWDTGSCPPSS
jgi:hypothetical protein